MKPKLQAKSRIRKIFNNYNTYKDYYLKVSEIDNSYFHKRYKEKIQVHKNGTEYILLKIDIFFSEHNLVVDIEEKDGDKDLNVELKKQELLEEELNYSFIRINTNNDLDYKISSIQKFINDIKDIKTKEMRDEVGLLRCPNEDLLYRLRLNASKDEKISSEIKSNPKL